MILYQGASEQTSFHSGSGGHSENIKRKERNESETGERNTSRANLCAETVENEVVKWLQIICMTKTPPLLMPDLWLLLP